MAQQYEHNIVTNNTLVGLAFVGVMGGSDHGIATIKYFSTLYQLMKLHILSESDTLKIPGKIRFVYRINYRNMYSF